MKTGDKIRCIKNEGYEGRLTKGKIYTAGEIINMIGSSYISVLGDDNHHCSCYQWRFVVIDLDYASPDE